MAERIDEFVWYHINGDGDCNGQVLRSLARSESLSCQDCFDLAFFYSITYCCASAIFLLERRNEIESDPKAFAAAYKERLIFQSDRKYVKMRDTFSRLLGMWTDKLSASGERFFHDNVFHGEIRTKQALRSVERWYYFSRFSAYLFVETYCDILDIKASRDYGMEYEGDNMTFAGGLFYVYNMDAEAEYVQQYHKLPIDTGTFEYLIRDLQGEVKRAGGDDNFTKLETSLCAYEKFFKGTRYNGYYADRMLAELVSLAREPMLNSAVGKVYRARKNAIDAKYRGESNGWDGVRSELKKWYKSGRGVYGYDAFVHSGASR